MRAIVTTRHGGPDVVELHERPVPEPAAGDVRVRVRACALNHLDLWIREGIAGVTYPLPLVPCADVAGVIDAIGVGVDLVAAGLALGSPVIVAPAVACGFCARCAGGRDHLCAAYGLLGEHRDGGAQDYIVVPARVLVPKPACLSFEEAAAMPVTFLTAWHMLVARAGLVPGQTVLVQGANSGVGTAAVIIARLLGARVFACARGPVKCGKALNLGAEKTFDTREAIWPKLVRAACPEGVDVVVEHVGAATWEGSIRALRRAGTIVTCGATTGHEVPLNLRRLFFLSHTILGSTMGSLGELHEVVRLAGQGRLRPIVDTVLPLEQFAQAMARLASGQVFGKLVLRVSEPD